MLELPLYTRLRNTSDGQSKRIVIENYLKCTLTEPRFTESLDSFLNWLASTDYYTAPASTKFHNNFPSGLVFHSALCHDLALEHYNALIKYRELSQDISMDSLIMCSLFHDLCKIGSYYTKDGEYRYYTKTPLGHGQKSAYYLMCFFQLLPQEFAAVANHMGPWQVGNMLDKIDSLNYSQAQEQYDLCKLIMVADTSTLIYEQKSK